MLVIYAAALEGIEDYLIRWGQTGKQPQGHPGARLMVDLMVDHDWLVRERARIDNVLISQRVIAQDPNSVRAERCREALRSVLLPETIRDEINGLEQFITDKIIPVLTVTIREMYCLTLALPMSSEAEHQAMTARLNELDITREANKGALADLEDEIERLRDRYI